MSEYDIFIKNINVIDGTGGNLYKSNVGIKNGKIDYIGNISDLEGATVIDGKGLTLSPGFIDSHGHFDGYVFHDNSNYSKLSQGVTTEISGNCGESLAPVTQKHLSEILKYYEFYYPPKCMAQFTSYKRYFEEIEKIKLGINVGFCVGHGTIRMAVMGFDYRIPTKKELEQMKELVREAMASGTFGISTGLLYPPGSYSLKSEIIELCKVVKEYGGVYTSHMRNEGDDVLSALEEAIDIGRQSGVPVIISHHKILGKNNWGKSIKTLEKIEKANEEGIEVGLDQYPYTACCTTLTTVMPPDYTEGGIIKLVERIKNRKNWDKIREDIFNPKQSWDNYIANIGYSGILILTAKATLDAEGKTIEEYAKIKRCDPLEAILDIIIKNGSNCLAAFYAMNEEDVEKIMKYSNTMIGSDGIPVISGEKTHPRLTGTFPRILGRYVREKKVLRIEDAIRKMTYLPANKFRLRSKGLVKEGFDADLVIFDSETIIDRADFKNPFSNNEGIKFVIVNGKLAMKDGKYTGAGSGRLIKLKR